MNEPKHVCWGYCPEYLGMINYIVQAESTYKHKPDDNNWSKDDTDSVGSIPLQHEKANQDGTCYWNWYN